MKSLIGGKIRSQKLGQWLFITFVRYSHCGVLGGSSCILTALKGGGGWRKQLALIV